MNLFIFSDESGVFDVAHNEIFVFAGILFLSREARDIAARKYIHAENELRNSCNIPVPQEIKASSISNKWKAKLYRSLNHCHKFGAVIKERNILQEIFTSKKSKQRFLDYAYKISVKRKLETFIGNGLINPHDVENLYFFVDEHTTATNGRYELREALEQEFKNGTYNYSYSKFFPPIFPNLKSVEVNFCNSAAVTLVRAADIVANRLYFMACKDMIQLVDSSNFHATWFPSNHDNDISFDKG